LSLATWFLVNPGFFHAYDRVCWAWVNQVLAAGGFGVLFRRWIAILYRGASNHFMLHNVSLALAVEFSIRQGTPECSPLYCIQVEPFGFGALLEGPHDGGPQEGLPGLQG
jgi:hypothetical protein